MDIWSVESIIIILIFFVPGFISMKVYDIFIPSERRDFSGAVYEAIGYSFLNYGAFIWLILIIYYQKWWETNFNGFIISLFFLVFIMPILWAIIYYNIATSKKLSKYIVHPIQKPWDYFFRQRKSNWVLINLRAIDKIKKIGGVYSSKSFSSSYPAEEQIYIEQVWELDEKGKFIKPISKSKGAIINGRDILTIEFFK